MTNDELRTILREELDGALVGFRGEINAAVSASETRVIQRMDEGLLPIDGRLGNVEDRLGGMEGHMARMEVRMDDMESSMGGMETRMSRMEVHMDGTEGRLSGVESRTGAIQKHFREIKGDLAGVDKKLDQCTQVLDEAVTKITDAQQSLFNLENKVDAHYATIRREIIRIDTAIEALMRQMLDISRRLNAHITTSWNQAHPNPNATAK